MVDGGQEVGDVHPRRRMFALERVAGDRLRVVARDAVEVATLHEHDEAVAGAVDVAERDGVGDEAPHRYRGVRSEAPMRFTARWVRWFAFSLPAAR